MFESGGAADSAAVAVPIDDRLSAGIVAADATRARDANGRSRAQLLAWGIFAALCGMFLLWLFTADFS